MQWFVIDFRIVFFLAIFILEWDLQKIFYSRKEFLLALKIEVVPNMTEFIKENRATQRQE